MPRYRKISFAPDAETVFVSSCPYRPGDPIESVSCQTFAKSLGLEGWYDSSLRVNMDFKPQPEHMATVEELTKERFEIVKASIKKYRDDFVISKMGSGLGYGVFARKAIRKGSYVALYGGHVFNTDFEDDGHSTYGMEICEDESGLGVKIDAQDTGNIARFFQDLPADPADENTVINTIPLSSCKFKAPYSLKDVATANLMPCIFKYKGHPIMLLKATKDINPGDQCGYPYGSGYWRHEGVEPNLFDHKGEIIPRSAYSYNPKIELTYLDDNKVKKKGVFNIFSLEDIKHYIGHGASIRVEYEKGKKLAIPPELLAEALKKYEKTPFCIKIDLCPKPSLEVKSAPQAPKAAAKKDKRSIFTEAPQSTTTAPATHNPTTCPGNP